MAECGHKPMFNHGEEDNTYLRTLEVRTEVAQEAADMLRSKISAGVLNSARVYGAPKLDDIIKLADWIMDANIGDIDLVNGNVVNRPPVSQTIMNLYGVTMEPVAEDILYGRVTGATEKPPVDDIVSSNIFTRIADEIAGQIRQFGEQDALPDGTGPNGFIIERPHPVNRYRYLAERAKQVTQANAYNGDLTWANILTEEFFEAMECDDSARLREELIQVSAVAARWAMVIDGRKRHGQAGVATETATAAEPEVEHDGDMVNMHISSSGYLGPDPVPEAMDRLIDSATALKNSWRKSAIDSEAQAEGVHETNAGYLSDIGDMLSKIWSIESNRHRLVKSLLAERVSDQAANTAATETAAAADPDEDLTF